MLQGNVLIRTLSAQHPNKRVIRFSNSEYTHVILKNKILNPLFEFFNYGPYAPGLCRHHHQNQ